MPNITEMAPPLNLLSESSPGSMHVKAAKLTGANAHSYEEGP